MGSVEHEIEDVIFIANHTSCKYSDDTIELLTALSPIRSVGVCHRLACNNHTSSGSVRVTHIVTRIIFFAFHFYAESIIFVCNQETLDSWNWFENVTRRGLLDQH